MQQLKEVDFPIFLSLKQNQTAFCDKIYIYKEYLIAHFKSQKLSCLSHVLIKNLISGKNSQFQLSFLKNFPTTSKCIENFLCLETCGEFSFIALENFQQTSFSLSSFFEKDLKDPTQFHFNSQFLLIFSSKKLFLIKNYLEIQNQDEVQKYILDVPEKAILDFGEKPRFILMLNQNNFLLLGNHSIFIFVFSEKTQKIHLITTCKIPRASDNILQIEACDFYFVLRMQNCCYLWNFQNLQRTFDPIQIENEGPIINVSVDPFFIFTADSQGIIKMYESHSGKFLWKISQLEPFENIFENFQMKRKGKWLFVLKENKLFCLDVNKFSVKEDISSWNFENLTPISIGFKENQIITLVYPLQLQEQTNDSYALIENSFTFLTTTSLMISEDTKINNQIDEFKVFLKKWKNIFNSLFKIGDCPPEYHYTTLKLSFLENRLENIEIQLPLALIKGLIYSGEQFINQLDEQIQKGSVLRNMNSPRLKRSNNFRNISVLKRIYDIENFLDEEFCSFQSLQLDRTELKELISNYEKKNFFLFTPSIFDSLSNPSANAMWIKHFGRKSAVEVSELMKAISFTLTPLLDAMIDFFKYILDFSNTGYITKYKFEEFLSIFGPFENCIENMISVLARNWFLGWLSLRESELLFQKESTGTFCVHFSQCSLDSLTITFKNGSSINHMNISTSFDPQGKVVFSTQESKSFPSLHSLIESQNLLFQKSFDENAISKKPWFWGDLSSSEITPLLNSQTPGTFCFRFSGNGQYAASFLNADRQVGHCLVSETSSGKLILQGFESNQFSNLDEMVDTLIKEVIFTKPLSTQDEKLLEKQNKDEITRNATLLREIQSHRNMIQKRKAPAIELNKNAKPFSINIQNPNNYQTLSTFQNQNLDDVLFDTFIYLSEQVHLLVQGYPQLRHPQLVEFAKIFKASSTLLDNFLIQKGYSQQELANFLNFSLGANIEFPPKTDPRILQVYQALQIISIKIFSVLEHLSQLHKEMDNTDLQNLGKFLLELMNELRIPAYRNLQALIQTPDREDSKQQPKEQESIYGHAPLKQLNSPKVVKASSLPNEAKNNDNLYAVVTQGQTQISHSSSLNHSLSNETYAVISKSHSSASIVPSSPKIEKEAAYSVIPKKPQSTIQYQSPPNKSNTQPAEKESGGTKLSRLTKSANSPFVLTVKEGTSELKYKTNESSSATNLYGTVAKKSEGQPSKLVKDISSQKPIEKIESIYGTIAKKPEGQPSKLVKNISSQKPIEKTESIYGKIAKKPENQTPKAVAPKNSPPFQESTYAFVSPQGQKSSSKLTQGFIEKTQTRNRGITSSTAKASHKILKNIGLAWDQNPERRKTMEDEHVFHDTFGGKQNRAYFSIYDGHGGRNCVEMVSQSLHETILKKRENNPNSSWADIFKNCYKELDLEVCSKLSQQKDRSGCTSVSIILDVNLEGKPTLYVANIGDSKAILIRNNNPIELTEEHNVKKNQSEVLRIKQMGGHVFGNKVGGQLSVTRAFGNQHLKDSGVISEPSSKEIPLTGSDTHLILGCDGLWDVVTFEQVSEIVLKSTDAQNAAEQLLRKALEKSRDNISVMVASFHSNIINQFQQLFPQQSRNTPSPARPISQTIFVNPRTISLDFDFLPSESISSSKMLASGESFSSFPPVKESLYGTIQKKTATPEQKTAPSPEKRDQCIKEIIQTEEKYQKDLKVLTDIFAVPIQISQSISDVEFQSIFSGIEPLLNLSAQFLSQWQNRDLKKDESLVLGEIFSTLSDYFKMYTNYVSNFEKALICVEQLKKKNPKFTETLKECEDSLKCEGVNCLGFLIKPVQRICKYPLLIRELIAQTFDVDALELLFRAQDRIDTVVEYVNEKKKTADSIQKVVHYSETIKTTIELVQATRRYIKNGPLIYLGAIHEIILFNDLLIITKQKTESPKYEVLESVGLNGCGFTVVSDTPNKKNAFVLKEFNNPNPFDFSTQTPEERISWIKAINQARRNLQQLQFEDKFGKRKSTIPPELVNPQRLSRGISDQIQLISPTAQARKSTLTKTEEIGSSKSYKKLFQFKNPFQKKKVERQSVISNPMSAIVPNQAPLIQRLKEESLHEEENPERLEEMLSKMILDLDDYLEN